MVLVNVMIRQIEYLESQLQAYKARTSLLQQEHLGVLDTVYEIRQRHQEELEQACNARDLALSRLKIAKDRLRAVEAERDDYKEAVLQLIERVEQSHGDFKHWPYSKLQLSNYLDPLLKNQPVNDRQSDLAYYNGLIHSIKRELYLERQAHSLTRVRVDILSAQVARRDAALEDWAQHADSAAAPPSGGIFVHDKGKGRSIMQRDLDRSEILASFDQTAANNRLLEQEIHSLLQYMEATRQNVNPLVHRSTSPHSAPLTSLPQSTHACNDELSHPVPLTNALDPAPSDEKFDRPVRVVQQGQNPVTSPRSYISPSPHRGRSLAASHQAPSKHKSRTRSQSHRRPSAQRSSSSSASPLMNVVQDLSEQIRLLSVQIDGLHAEHVVLSRFIQSQREEVTVTPDVLHGDSSFNSYDTDEDPSIVVHAGIDFEHETAVPGEPLDDVKSDHGTGVDAVQGEGGGGDVTDGGERSMEIATPLISTLVTFPVSSEGDDAPHDVQIGQTGAEEDQSHDEIKMIRPRRGASVSPPVPP
ncbi:hypothetical protein C0993_007310 [Termitomyces sp. T159_Od127]|nr:hypothetical protein C0993_007310 [Termitomyces sp. T159_Od127]